LFPFLFNGGQKGWIEVISTMRSEGYTQESIREKVGWSRPRVNDYTRVLNNIDGDVLAKAKSHQVGRSSLNDGAPSL